ncbi:unnamed protein product, partial [Aphanomyces euteiches]
MDFVNGMERHVELAAVRRGVIPSTAIVTTRWAAMGARRKKFGGSLAVTTRHLGALRFATPGKTLSLICISTFALMAPQVYFVTGANKGIGYEAVRILAEKFGDQAIVLLGTRSLKNGEDAIAKMKQANSSFDYANVHLVEIDVSNKESIQAAADFVKA